MTAPSLQQAADDYLVLRRSFGYRLGGHDRPLADFVTYLDGAGLDTVTVEAALAWAVQPAATPLRHAQRLSIARGFAAYLHSLDPRSEVPPRDLLPAGYRWVPPHIYTTDEIAELMAQSRRLRPPLRAATMETIIGLLVVTGMRSGETVRLDRGDVDLDAGRVRVIATKFNTSRELALHPTTVGAWRATDGSVTAAGRALRRWASSFRAPADAWRRAASTGPSPSWCAEPGSSRHRDR